MSDLSSLVTAARDGDLAAYESLIRATRAMVYGVSRRVLSDRSDALDACQEAYLRGYRGLHTLREASAFPAYIRRIAVRTAHDARRARRATFAPFDEAIEVPVLDDQELRWSSAQRAGLARALVRLPREERRAIDRFYHGGWSLARLAEEAGISEPAMRKRLSRTRDKLREEIEIMERTLTRGEDIPESMSERVLELLSRPALVDLPESMVGQVADRLKSLFSDYQVVETNEIVDLDGARARLAHDPVYVPEDRLFHVSNGRILRYDLSLPLTLSARGRGAPLKLLCTGKVYRNETESATHLSAFHQLELLSLDVRERNAPWLFIGRVLQALDELLPGAAQRVDRTEYPFCTRAWDIGVELHGDYVELLGCGIYKPDVVSLLGGDPDSHVALGLGIGLDRLASLRFQVPDLRKLSG